MSDERKWVKGLDIAIAVIAVIAVVYHLVVLRMWVGGPLMHQNRHLAIILTLVFLSAARKQPKYWPIREPSSVGAW